MMYKPSHHIKELLYFLIGNYIFSLFLAREYLSFAPTFDTHMGWFYTRIAFFSHFAMILMIVGIILLPFTLFIRGRIQMWILPPLIMFIYQTMLLFYEMTHITLYQKLFPLYQPLFMDETFEKYLGWKKERSPALLPYQTGTMLNYPLKEPDISGNLQKWNIVWIAVESWRFDMMNDDITPNIADFSKQAIVFNKHFSGGNASRFGIFTMFYGIYGTYWHQFLAERRSPVFMDTLMKLDYDFKILSSTKLTYPEMRSTAFVKVPEHFIEDHIPGKAGDERDNRRSWRGVF